MPDLVLRAAAPDDADLIFTLVAELADYERLSHEMVSTAESLRAALFAPSPKVFCEIAEWAGEPAGLALWFYDFSTFLGQHGIYLEDLFVRPAFRGKAIGKRLLERLARRCAAENLGRMTWSVLDWNQPAIDFYRGHGAELLGDWTTCRVSGEALIRLGQSGPAK